MKENQASSTAFTVMQGILHIAKNDTYKHLVDDETISIGQQILAASSEGQKRLKQLKQPWFSWSVKLREAIILPGITLHYALRKRHVETTVFEAIANGITQIVTLGAGFDTLSWRLHARFPQVNFIETDHPATQKIKLAGLPQTYAPNIHFLSIDFTKQTLLGALSASSSFDPKQSTLFICEGVLMYLSQQDVDVLFNSIKQLCNAKTQFLFSTLEPRNSPKNSIPKILYRHLDKIGEPILWDLASDAMADYLQSHNCVLTSIAGKTELLQAYMKEDLRKKLHSGEFFTLCEFVSSSNSEEAV